MQLLQKWFSILLLVVSFSNISFAQYGELSIRSLLEKKIYFLADGKVGNADYWSIPLGTFDCKLSRPFPGEGKVEFSANLNFSLISSGYIEGNGYGSRGKTNAEGYFVIDDGDSVKQLDFNDIDYIYDYGNRVVLSDGKEHKLYVYCEGNKNEPYGLQIMIWNYNKKFSELKHFKDFKDLSAFSFTKSGFAKAKIAQAKMKYND
jgi:hypothetical protein